MDEKRECDGHCEFCNMNQRTYCAAQMAFYNQKEIESIKSMLSERNKDEIQTNVGLKRIPVESDESVETNL